MLVHLNKDAVFRATTYVPPNFTIVSEGEEFQCHLLMCAAHSGTIALKVVEDPGLNRYVMETADPEKRFKSVLDLINGETIEIDSENAQYMHNVGFELAIHQLMSASRPYLYDKGANSTISFSPLAPFQGIFSYFQPNHDELDFKVIVSSCSSYGNEHELVNPEDTLTYWESADKPNQFVEFDFNNKKVILSAYSLKSSSNESDMIHPKAWIVAGSNNQEDWITLHQVDYSNDLNGGSLTMSWECNEKQSEEPFKYIRFEMVEPNHYGNWVFRLSRVELFGTLIEA